MLNWNSTDTHPPIPEISASLPYALGLSLSLLAFLYLRSLATWNTRSRRLSTPPGPRSLPFFGNALDMPKAKQWEGFRDLCAKYGDILCLHVFTQPVVVLGSADVIVEYLDKRSANTSDRKQTASLKLMGYDTSFGLMPYGPEWKLRRRAFWQHFSPTAVGNYQNIQRETTRTFLRTLLEHSRDIDIERHLTKSVATTLLRVLYGIETQNDIDEAVAAIQGGLEGGRQVLVSGGFLVDFFPILRYSPSFVPFQRRFAKWRTGLERLMNTPFACYQAAAEKLGDDAPPCVVGGVITSLLKDDQEKEHVADIEFIAKRIAVDSMEAGTDSVTLFILPYLEQWSDRANLQTVSTLTTVLLAMSLYPNIQKKAQAELDAVVGPDRFPDFSDRDLLVYIDAIIKEALRWMPSAPLGLTHCTRNDDELRGYFIPAGTVLMANIWACLRDPEAYENPEEFHPERFLRDGKLDPSVRDPSDFIFGFGRRTCPGRHFGLAALFINVASVLHTFNISRPLDDCGREIVIEPRMANGFVSHPEDSRVQLKPRSPEAEALILRSTGGAIA
ncbi:cytochrome P450 [Ganoderma sinense ZZ0214-1]|uniref:Cytochrome P450 n=1 Tax=Ganoderma sinense ZZ0214-1 TaxID=1077348 RepID=A0A2G8RN90_9APHY|nr:cytochrome P450 [Ganoderma sinense ZZ0214-1]